MISPLLINPKTLRILERTCLFVGATFFLTTAFLAISGLVQSAAEKQARSESAAASREIEKLTQTIENSKQIKTQTKRKRGFNAVAAFQQTLEKSAQAHGAEVSEFISNTESTPYLSRYTNETTEKGWLQHDVKTTLSGSLEAVVETIKGLQKTEAHFEMDSLELSRTRIDSSGKAILTANAAFRVLKKEGEA